MTPERWQQIERIYHSVLELEENQRAAFLEKACAGDEELKREVESLLAFEPRAGSFIESPPQEALKDAAQGLAAEPTVPELSGDIGHYQILSRLGEGGMGVVYKARDKSLGRSVAFKVLSAGLVADPEHRRRLVLEARMASALNHPNIVTVHEISSQDGIDFIVMEYVAGKTLDQLIPRHGLPLKEALTYAIQIADGLAAAHAAGIVHRDLKPGNVMVSNNGLVKVLDFGLAKLTLKAASVSSDVATMPELSGPTTGEGTLLGTVSYMSPEQAEGKPLDARSDVFSFGLLLYEMVTGQRAFKGDSTLAILTAILREEPKPVTQIVKDIPPELERIISRCLRKERERRSQTMSDVKIALEEVKEELGSKTGVRVSAPTAGRRRTLIWSILVLALLVAGGVAVWLNRSATRVAEAPLRVVPLTSYPGEEHNPSFSPDGNLVAFSWNGEKEDNFDIYVKDIRSGAQIRLTTAPEVDSNPSWSPDGRSIAFVREGPRGNPEVMTGRLEQNLGNTGMKTAANERVIESDKREHYYPYSDRVPEKSAVYLVSPLGPPERKVAEIRYFRWFGGFLPWTPDGRSLVVSERSSKNEPFGLSLLALETGEKRRLTLGQVKELGDIHPALSPDGRTLVFSRQPTWALGDIYSLTLSEGFQPVEEPKRLTFENRMTLSPVWTSDGREVIFSSSSGPFSGPSLFRIAPSGSGKPQRLAGIGENASEPTIARHTQRLAYTSELVDMNVWRVEVPGSHQTTGPPMKLISSTRRDHEAEFSPDGRKIAFASNRSGSEEIWVCNSDGSQAQQLTSLGTGSCGNPRWSPDGGRIAFDSNIDGWWATYVISTNGGQPKRLTKQISANEGIGSWSRDGRWIYFASDRGGEYQIRKVPAGGGEAVQVTRKGGAVALESADGNWVYFTKTGEASSLWKVPKDGGEETQVLVSVDARAFAVVKEGIYFIPRPDSAGGTSIQFFNFTTKKLRSITTIARPVGFYLSVSPDERWILYSQVDQESSDLMLVENFR